MDDRVRAEQLAYDSGSVEKNWGAMRRRFSHVFDCPNALWADEYRNQVIAAHTAGATVLELGCLYGRTMEKLHPLGPQKLIGIDISTRGIEVAKRERGDIAEFHVMDAHSLEFPDESVDLVIGNAILHHLDFQRAILELLRVLRPGGHAVFMEPLRDNPLAKLYRAITPKARTVDELPLSRAQLTWADSQFSSTAHAFCGLVSPSLAMLTSLTPLPADNAVLRFADWADRKLAATLIRYWMRVVTLVWRK